MATLPTVRVVAGVVARGDEILIQQRRADQARPLLWEFPGGKVEEGESDERALEREFLEELGVEVQVEGEPIWTTSHRYPDLVVELSLFKASIAEGATPLPRESQTIAWVARAQLEGYAFCEADRPLIPLLAAGKVG